jgi:hypothetical protein
METNIGIMLKLSWPSSVIDDVEITHLPINLTYPSLNLWEESSPNLTQEAMKFHNLLSLPHLLIKQIAKKEPSIDYPQSHIVILA